MHVDAIQTVIDNNWPNKFEVDLCGRDFDDDFSVRSFFNDT